jgi:glutamate synthase (NADPH/NADH)
LFNPRLTFSPQLTDCRRGQSLIVWGINEGRQAAREIDIYLMGNTRLPVTGGIEQRPVESLEVMNLVETDTSNKSH